jgi:transposase, IS6 family
LSAIVAGDTGFVPRLRPNEAAGMKRRRPIRPIHQPNSAFSGFRFSPEVILVAVRWYLRYGLSYRDLEELLAERGIEVDHVTLFRWVQRFTPILATAAGPCRHAVSSRWFVDETYVKVSGSWRYVYRAVDEQGQVIDVFVSKKRDTKAADRFFANAVGVHGAPSEVTTDRSPVLARALTELLPFALHDTTQYANNRIEADHGRLKARLRPGLKRDRTASVVIRGHAFIQNLRRGHYELGVDALPGMTLAAAFDELALLI